MSCQATRLSNVKVRNVLNNMLSGMATSNALPWCEYGYFMEPHIIAGVYFNFIIFFEGFKA